MQVIHAYIVNIDNVINYNEGNVFSNEQNDVILQASHILITKTANNMKKKSSQELTKIFQVLNFAKANISRFNQLFDIILIDNN